MPYHKIRIAQQVKPRRTSTARPKSSINHRGVAHPLLRLQRSLGNQAIQRVIHSHQHDRRSMNLLSLQAKLMVGSPGDKYEQEADKVATRVMTMPNPASSQSIQRGGMPEEQEEPMAQTKSIAASITPLGQRQSVEEEDQNQSLHTKYLSDSQSNTAQRVTTPEEEETVQMQPASAEPSKAGVDVEKTVKQSQGGGSSLPNSVRTYMEPRFGADFREVRVHQGSESAKMNRALSAQAFTVGKDIYLGAGKTAGNSHLLAHELTHVIQQTGRVRHGHRSKNSKVQKACAACSTKGGNVGHCPACKKEKGLEPKPTYASSEVNTSGNHTLLQSQAGKVGECMTLWARCTSWCVKNHLYKFPPDTSGFNKCKQGCNWCLAKCRKDGLFPCIWPGR